MRWDYEGLVVFHDDARTRFSFYFFGGEKPPKREKVLTEFGSWFFEWMLRNEINNTEQTWVIFREIASNIYDHAANRGKIMVSWDTKHGNVNLFARSNSPKNINLAVISAEGYSTGVPGVNEGQGMHYILMYGRDLFGNRFHALGGHGMTYFTL